MSMYCGKCGKPLKDGSKFCAYCGSPQEEAGIKNAGGQKPEEKAGISPQFPGKSLAILIGAAVIGLSLIAAALIFALKPGNGGQTGESPEAIVQEEIEQETESLLSEEEQQVQEEARERYSSLERQEVSRAFSMEQDLIADYKTKAEEFLESGDISSAHNIMDHWQNLLTAIQGNGAYEMTVEQVDVNEYPLVKVYVRIQDRADGTAVNSLLSEGFHIYEKPDGTPEFVKREVTYASQLNNEENVNISMVADVSGSMIGEPLSEAKWVMENFLNTIQTGAGDRVSLISFSDQVDIQTGFTSDISAARAAVDGLSTYDMTALYDALYVAVNQTAAQSGAKCVIAFTDGKDNASKCTPEIIIELAKRYSIPIFIIGVGDDLDGGELAWIADETKGFYRTVNQVNGMSDIYDAIFREQKEMYLLEYETLQQNDRDVARNLNLDYVDGTMAVRQEYCYVPSVYMEVNTSMAQMFVNDYIIYDSDRRYVTSADLDRLTKEQLRLARNEIYARRGRLFKDTYLQDYFNARSWYHGSIAPEAFSESCFNDYERANAYFIADYERLKGYIR